MAKINQQTLETLILNGGQHTYDGLCHFFGADATMQMQVDRTLQKLRKKKLIAYKRVGKSVIWSAVPEVVEAIP